MSATKTPTKKPAPAKKAKTKAPAAKPPAPAKKATPSPAPPKKFSVLDAAHAVLTREAKALNTQDLIKAMAEAKLWTSPGGKTPHATLYSALLREISTKGTASRFRKASKGHFEAAS